MRPTPRATYTRSFRDGPKTAKLRTSNAASLRNRTPPRANLMPAEASASKRGYDSRPQALSRPPRGVASNLTPSHAARWERRTWELLNSFCLHWSVAEAVPPVEPEPVDGLASTGDGHSAPIVKLPGLFFSSWSVLVSWSRLWVGSSKRVDNTTTGMIWAASRPLGWG